MRIILVGPPGAGKGTQASALTQKLSVPHISSGDLLRTAVANGTELGRKADGFMRSGALVPDDLVIAMVLERIALPDAQNGFLLDGFPRTRPQAEALDRALAGAQVDLDAVVLIEVPDQLIIERITGRRQDPETGAIYHLQFQPPPPEIADRLVQRADDTDAACVARLQKYHSETTPLIPFYEGKGLLRRVSGIASPAEVTEAIVAALDA
ncbi:MAG TPA: adenylate kinase [Kofleriaceae bacterium]|nr:adenylate kinase [Kofleriaceae bacterium]